MVIAIPEKAINVSINIFDFLILSVSAQTDAYKPFI